MDEGNVAIIVRNDPSRNFQPPGNLQEALLLREGEWAVPRLWRSEFRNILSTSMRLKLLTLDAAVAIDARAEALVADNEYDVSPLAVLRLA